MLRTSDVRVIIRDSFSPSMLDLVDVYVVDFRSGQHVASVVDDGNIMMSPLEDGRAPEHPTMRIPREWLPALLEALQPLVPQPEEWKARYEELQKHHETERARTDALLMTMRAR